ncbi:MAG: threonylcarbamoyl-AMP synthase [Anaerolineae bacterium]|nr:threonylcarbamoyl-AMP synthase [Anaerolineae bacterium]
MGTKVVRIDEAGALERAVEVLAAGGLVAFPTDTVYGLAALPMNPLAIDRIYKVKGRSASRPIALLLASGAFVSQVAVLPENVQSLVRRFWPGGLTLVVPKTEAVSEKVSQGPKVGVRVPNLQVTLDLLLAAGGVLAVTSANRSGEPAALSAEGVLEQLRGRVELVLDGGRRGAGVPSTVLDCTTWPPTVLRAGAVSEDAILMTLRRAGVL